MLYSRIGLFPSIALMLALVACGGVEKCYVNIPEGSAPLTLKEFAKQASVEIVFNAPSVVGVTTNSVEGRMTPEDALDAMLSGTGLSYEVDSETGVYAVTLIEISDTRTQERNRVSILGYSNENTKNLKFF